jgi:hypothetical protein
MYFANSACQSASLIGGTTPVMGRQSVMDNPLPVNRVTPPMATMMAMAPQTSISQSPTARGGSGAASGGFMQDSITHAAQGASPHPRSQGGIWPGAGLA